MVGVFVQSLRSVDSLKLPIRAWKHIRDASFWGCLRVFVVNLDAVGHKFAASFWPKTVEKTWFLWKLKFSQTFYFYHSFWNTLYIHPAIAWSKTHKGICELGNLELKATAIPGMQPDFSRCTFFAPTVNICQFKILDISYICFSWWELHLQMKFAFILEWVYFCTFSSWPNCLGPWIKSIKQNWRMYYWQGIYGWPFLYTLQMTPQPMTRRLEVTAT